MSSVSAEEIVNDNTTVVYDGINIEQEEIITAEASDWYVDTNATGTGNGSETNPFNNLKTALNNAIDGDSRRDGLEA